MRGSALAVLLTVACLAIWSLVTSAQVIDSTPCEDACYERESVCIDECSEHRNPVECEARCHDELADCLERCR